MKPSKYNHGNKLKLSATILIAIVLLLFYWNSKKPAWSQITSYGGIYSNIFKNRNHLVYGTNYSRFYVTNLNNNDTRSLDLNTGSVLVQSLINQNALVISRNSLYKIDTKKMHIIWRYDSQNEYSLDRSEIHGNSVYVSDQNGSIYVLELSTGQMLWKFESKGPTILSPRLVDGSVRYASDFWVKNGRVYIADREGTFFVLNYKNGKEIWRKSLGETLASNITIYKDQIILYGSSGKGISLNKKDGSILWEQEGYSAPTCSTIFKKNLFDKKLIRINADGKVSMANIETGQTIWESETFGSGLNCPYVFSKSGVFSHSSGRIIKIDMNNGKTIWKKDGFGKIVTAPAESRSIFSKKYIFSDLSGAVWAIDDNQKIYWKYEAGYPIYTPILVDNNNIYIGTANGSLFRINKLSGKAVSNRTFLSYSTKLESKYVGENQIFEISLLSKSIFLNPWSEGHLSGIFTHESGREVKVNGFYYDGQEWKLRFNSPDKGLWKYRLTWVDHGVQYFKNGTLKSSTDTKNSIIRIDKKSPTRLTLDGKTIFNGVGIQEIMYDFNSNGTPLDDWATGTSESFNATSSSGVSSHFRSDRRVLLSEYADIYGPSGAGFNIYRYSIMNANNPLYRQLETPIVYSIQEGKVADELLTTLTSKNIHVWLAFFNFDVPYKNTLTETEKRLIESYMDYVISRYGPYVDIWELVNECTLPPALKDFMITVIKKYDFENRLVTTSFEDPSYPGIDIVSPHWYESEDLTESDLKTSEYIDKFKSFQKPVIFGEQGNATTNWDALSATRMRIRLWTAFFKEGVIIFWNDSTKKGVKQTPPFYANIYIGDEERAYVKSFQNFSNSFALESKPVIFRPDNNAIRGYGLVSENLTAGFFVHTDPLNSETTFNLKINTKSGGELQWTDPSTGTVIKKQLCPAGDCVITSPSFKTDVAFKIY